MGAKEKAPSLAKRALPEAVAARAARERPASVSSWSRSCGGGSDYIPYNTPLSTLPPGSNDGIIPASILEPLL